MAPKRPSMQAPPPGKPSSEEESSEEEASDGVGERASSRPPPPSNKPSKKKTSVTPQLSSSTFGADESEEGTGERASSRPPPPPPSYNKKPTQKKTTVTPQSSSSADGADESKEGSGDSFTENHLNIAAIPDPSTKPLPLKPAEETSKSKKMNVTSVKRTSGNDREKKDSKRAKTDKRGDKAASSLPPPPSYSNSKPSEKRTTVSPPSSSSTDGADESEEESDDSDTENPPKIASIPDASANPLAAKPTDETSKSNEKVIPVNGASENDMEKKDSNMAKADGSSPLKRPLFVRIWSEDDEIAILNGLFEYGSEKGVDPFRDLNVFYEFAKKSVRADVSKSQFIDKVRKLKQKFKDNVKKGKKNGEDPVFKKTHDGKVFVLSKKIWGGEAVKSVEAKSADGKTPKGTKSEVSRKNAENSKDVEMPNLCDDKEEKGLEMENYSDDAVSLRCWVKYSEKLGVSDMDERSMKEGLELLPNWKKRELAERWKKLVCREMEIYLNRVELLRDRVNMVRMAVWSKYRSET
ncbi:GLABROUS1 enhancer-binding protein family [Dillenia turbinata]|uniref:GLABROUS1 enhancer-binding protein family n=1 Tax=Dillenia turbinata TaxID=194707 RepID=A0AAN8VB82_9MAGN